MKDIHKKTAESGACYSNKGWIVILESRMDKVRDLTSITMQLLNV